MKCGYVNPPQRAVSGPGFSAPMPCPNEAVRTCPNCKTPLCNQHSRRMPDGEGRRGFRECSECGHEWQ